MTVWSIFSWIDTINTFIRSVLTTRTLWVTSFTDSNTIIEELVVTITRELRSMRVFWTGFTTIFVIFTSFTLVRTLFTFSSFSIIFIERGIITTWTATGWGVDTDVHTAITVSSG